MTKKLCMLVALLTLLVATEGVKAQDINALLNVLKDAEKNQDDRANAKRKLVDKHGVKALDGLIQIFQSIPREDDESKWFAAVAIGQIVENAVKANDPLTQALKDNCTKVFEAMFDTRREGLRYWGLKGLVLLNDPNIKERILNEYKGNSSFSRWKLMLLYWLKDLNAPELTDILIGIVNDQNARLDFVVNAMAILGDKAKDPKVKKAVKPIMEQRFLNPKQPLFIKKAAADALKAKALTGKDFRFPPNLGVKDALKKINNAIKDAQKWWDAHKDDPDYN